MLCYVMLCYVMLCYVFVFVQKHTLIAAIQYTVMKTLHIRLINSNENVQNLNVCLDGSGRVAHRCMLPSGDPGSLPSCCPLQSLCPPMLESASLCHGHALRQPFKCSVWQLRTSGNHYWITFVMPVRCQPSVLNWKHMLLLHIRDEHTHLHFSVLSSGWHYHRDTNSFTLHHYVHVKMQLQCLFTT